MRFRLVLWEIVCVSVILFVCYLLNMYVCDCVLEGVEILILPCYWIFCFYYFSAMDGFAVINGSCCHVSESE